MIENEGQGQAAAQDEQPQEELSPSEKLEENPPTGSLTPGAQDPDSEIKNEVNPNTE